MLGHFKKSASILTDQETQMVGNDQLPATTCNTAMDPENRPGSIQYSKPGF